MDLKNEKWKVYSLGRIFLVSGMVVNFVAIILINSNYAIFKKLIVSQWLLFSLLFVLIGTKELIAKHNKLLGFCNYLTSAVAFIYIIRLIYLNN